MFYFLILIGLYVFIKTVSYGIYEIKNNNNKIGGILVIVIRYHKCYCSKLYFIARLIYYSCKRYSS